MRARSYFCTAVLLMLTFCTASEQQLQSSQAAALPVGSATITDIKGEVSLQGPQGETITGAKGVTLAADSTIETGKGSVLLELQDASQVLVKPHSRVVLRTPDQTKGYYLELLIGKVVNKVTKRLGSTPSFRMGTPTAVITVRGTRFEVEVDKKLRTSVSVYEGLVEVQALVAGNPSVFVRPGFWTNVNRDRASDPRRMLDSGEDHNRPGRGGEGLDRGEGQGQRQGGDRENSPSRSGPDD